MENIAPLATRHDVKMNLLQPQVEFSAGLIPHPAPKAQFLHNLKGNGQHKYKRYGFGGKKYLLISEKGVYPSYTLCNCQRPKLMLRRWSLRKVILDA